MPYIKGQFVNKTTLSSGAGMTAPSLGGTALESGAKSAIPGQSNLQQLLGLYALSKGNPTGAWSILSEKPSSDASTQAEKSRALTGLTMVPGPGDVSDKTLKDTGSIKAYWTDFKLNGLGGLLKGSISKDEKELVDLESKYFLLIQSVLTAVQGSRPSDYDVKSYQDKAGPSIKLPYYINQQRINNLQNLLRSKAGLEPLPSKPDLSSFEQ